MRILLIGECPWVPSSAGRITYLLARGFIELGHDVLVECAGTGRPFTRFVNFNPRRWGRVFAQFYPDVDIYVAPARVGNTLRGCLEFFNSRPDVVVAYGTSYGDVLGSLNDDIGKSGIPSVLYLTNDIVNLNPSFAASILSYTYVSGPTKASLDEVVKSLRVYYVNVDEFLDRFSVSYHGIDFNLYNRKLCSELCFERDDQHIIGMFAKNHVRKDYLALAYVVGRLVREGYNVFLGMFSVRGISAPVWILEHINEQVELAEGVSLLDAGRIRTFDVFDDVEGVPEDAVIHMYCSLLDTHVFLTRGESFGLPPVESLAFEVPTLSTAIPPQVEIFNSSNSSVIPLIDVELDRQMHPGLYIVDVDDAYRKVKAVLEGVYDFRPAYSFVRKYDYLSMSRGLLDVFKSGHSEPLSRKLLKRAKVLTKNLPGSFSLS